MRTRNEWENIVRTYTGGMNEGQIAAVVKLCTENDNGVWHNMAVVLRNLDVCHCSPCTRARKAA